MNKNIHTQSELKALKTIYNNHHRINQFPSSLFCLSCTVTSSHSFLTSIIAVVVAVTVVVIINITVVVVVVVVVSFFFSSLLNVYHLPSCKLLVLPPLILFIYVCILYMLFHKVASKQFTILHVLCTHIYFGLQS